MEKPRKKTPPMPRPAAAEEEEPAPPLLNRCPFCREGVDPETSVVCQGCLARHHAACWDEAGGSCSACRGRRRFEPAPLTLSRAIELLEGHGYSAEQVRAVLGAGHERETLGSRLGHGVVLFLFTGGPLFTAGMYLTYSLLGDSLSLSEQRALGALIFTVSFLLGFVLMLWRLLRRER